MNRSGVGIHTPTAGGEAGAGEGGLAADPAVPAARRGPGAGAARALQAPGGEAMSRAARVLSGLRGEMKPL